MCPHNFKIIDIVMWIGIVILMIVSRPQVSVGFLETLMLLGDSRTQLMMILVLLFRMNIIDLFISILVSIIYLLAERTEIVH